jgi:flagellar basal body-associated protein FliL
MELWIIIAFCLVLLAIVVGGYVYMFLHIMRCDPREIAFREKTGHKNNLIAHKYKDEAIQ